MKTRRTEVAVIGAGTAGLNARRAAERCGVEALLIEAGPYGTTCARVGCMPSKLLIAAADAAHAVSRAGDFGVRVRGEPQIDGRAVLDRVRRERDRFVSFVVDSVERIPESLRVQGRARFVGPASLVVGDELRIDARAVVVATGSVPRVPPELRDVPGVLVSDDIFEFDELPGSIAVIGTGVIALELGQALHRLGVRTAIFGHSDRLGPLTDPAVRDSAREVLGAELTLRLGAEIEVTRLGQDGLRVRWRSGNGDSGEETFDRILVATGRVPRLDGLDLERAGIELDARGVPRVDPRTLQAGDTPVFVAGDANAERPVLHEAAEEGRIAGTNAARFPETLAAPRRTPLSIVFTRPEMAIVGEPLGNLDSEAVEFGSVDYTDQGRARVMGENAGCVRIAARRECGTILGAEMFGPRVEHTAHLLAWAIEARQTVQRALDNPVYHPVVEEGIVTALHDLSSRLRLRPPPRPHDLDCPPGS